MEWLPFLLSGVSSIASGVMGANAAAESSKAMTEALQKAMKYDQKTLNKVLGLNRDTVGNVLGLNRDATNASNTQNAGTDSANAAIRGAETQGRADLAPWMDAGADALEAYSGELGLTAPGGAPYVSKFRETEGYKFKKAEGEKSIVNNLARLGMKGSGAAWKELDRYGTGVADQEHDDYMANLAGLSASGQQASTNAAQISQNAGAGVSANTMTGAGNNAGNILGTAGQNAGMVLGGANSTAGIRMDGSGRAGDALMTGNANAMDAILNKTGNISDNMINTGTAQGTGTVAATNSWTNALKDFSNSIGRTLGATNKNWGNILGGGSYAGAVT